MKSAVNSSRTSSSVKSSASDGGRGRRRAATARAPTPTSATNVRVVRSLSSSARSSALTASPPVSAKNASSSERERGARPMQRDLLLGGDRRRPARASRRARAARRRRARRGARAARARARAARGPARAPRSPAPSSPPSTCSSVPCPRSSPLAMTTTSSTDCATSASRWLETSTARPFGRLLAQQPAHPADAGRVEAVRRLVEDQHLRVAEQRGGDRQPLAHAHRVALHAAVGGVGRGRRRRAPRRRGPAGCSPVGGQHAQVVARGAAGVERGVLEHGADLRARAVELLVAPTVERRGARRSAGRGRAARAASCSCRRRSGRGSRSRARPRRRSSGP